MRKITLFLIVVLIVLFLSGCSESRVRVGVNYHSIRCCNCSMFHHRSRLVHCYPSISHSRDYRFSSVKRSPIIHNNYPIIHNRAPERHVVAPVRRENHNNKPIIRREPMRERKSPVQRPSSVRRIPSNGRKK